MSENSQENDSNPMEDPQEEVLKEDINQQFGLYTIIFLVNYYFSWLLAGFVFL